MSPNTEEDSNEFRSAVVDGWVALLALAKEASAACPIAQSAFGGMLWIVESAKQFKENKEEWTSYSAFVGELLQDLARSAKEFGSPPPADYAEDIKNLTQTVDSIRSGMEGMQRRRGLSKLLQTRDDPNKIAGFRQTLNTAMIRFNTLHLMSQTMRLVSIEAKIDVLTSTGKGELSQERSTPNLLPPVSAHLFGRDEYVTRIVDGITQKCSTERPAHFAILGVGGMGKTSVALHVLHHSSVKEAFGESIHFFSCEAVTTAASLIVGISATLGVQQSDAAPLWRLTSGLARLSKRLILCLDNFETCWLTDSRAEVQKVLEHLAASQYITLLVTMRGLERPAAARISWDKLEPIPALQLDAARLTYLSITQDESSGSALDRLLKLVDSVPLAITLLARRSQATGDSVELLLEAWTSQQLDTISLEPSGKDDNMDVSIRLTVDSKPVQEDPLAQHLLAILGLLPDGATKKDLLDWTKCSGQSSGTRAIWTLKKMALVYEDVPERLRTLSLVRNYAHRNLKPERADFDAMTRYFYQLINSTRVGEAPGSDHLTALQQLRPEVGNITSLFTQLIEESLDIELSRAVIDLTAVLLPERRNMDLLELLLTKGDTGLDAFLHAYAKHLLGSAYCERMLFEDAKVTLEETRKEYQSIGDLVGAASCLKTLGDNFSMHSMADEAEAAYKQAQSEYDALGHCTGVAGCRESFGDHLRKHARFAEAKELGLQARTSYLEEQDRFGAACCLHRIAQVLICQGLYSAAEAALDEAIQEFKTYGYEPQAGYCQWDLSEILLLRGCYAEAEAVLQHLATGTEELGLSRESTWVKYRQATLFAVASSSDSAQEFAEDARAAFKACDDIYAFHKGGIVLADAQCSVGQFSSARSILLSAKDFFHSRHYPLEHSQSLQSLAIVSWKESRDCTAVQMLEDARAEFESIGAPYEVARSIFSLASIRGEQGLSHQAKELYQQAMTVFQSIHLPNEVAKCQVEIDKVDIIG